MNLIIIILLSLIIITFKVYERKKYHIVSQNIFYKKINIIIIILCFFSGIIFITSLLINKNINNFKNIINSFSIALILIPLAVDGLNSYYIVKNKDNIKRIITNNISKSWLIKFNRAGINIILLSDKIKLAGIKTYKEDEISNIKNQLNKNIIIKTTKLDLIDNLVNEKDTLWEFNDLNKAYNEILELRGKRDNYIKAIKYLLITNIPFILCYLLLMIMKFPWEYNLLITLIIKLFMLIITRNLFTSIPFDSDIMDRDYNDKIIFGSQEIIFILIQIIFNTFVISLPYMFIMASGGSLKLAGSILYIMFIYLNIFAIFSFISEDNIFKNILKCFKKRRILIWLVVLILFSIFLNINNYLGTVNISLINYFSCILFGFISILINEFIKLLRQIAKKRRLKNE